MSAEILDKSKTNKNIIKYIAVLLIFLGALVLSIQSEGQSKFPKSVTDEFTFTAWVNDGEDYLKKNYRWITKIIAGYIKSGYYFNRLSLVTYCLNFIFTMSYSWWFKTRFVLFICYLFLGWSRHVGRIFTNFSVNGSFGCALCFLRCDTRCSMLTK